MNVQERERAIFDFSGAKIERVAQAVARLAHFPGDYLFFTVLENEESPFYPRSARVAHPETLKKLPCGELGDFEDIVVCYDIYGKLLVDINTEFVHLSPLREKENLIRQELEMSGAKRIARFFRKIIAPKTDHIEFPS